MSTAEGTSETGNNNEENMTDNDNGNTMQNTDKELTNQELDQIIQNITMAGSADQMSNLTNAKENDAVKDVLTGSLNNGSDSHDEDILLRWDDDEDDLVTEQRKMDDMIFQEIQDYSDQIVGSSKTETDLLSDVNQSNNGNIITNIIENFVSDEPDDSIMDEVLSESEQNIHSLENEHISCTNNDDMNMLNNFVSIGSLTSDHPNNNENTSKTDDECENLISSSELILNPSSYNVCAQIEENHIIGCSTSKINEDTNIDRRIDASPLEAGIDTDATSIIDETKLTCLVKSKVDEALKELKHESQENYDSEQEEKSCEANIKFLAQQLKVLSQSINTNVLTPDALDDIVKTEPSNDSCKTVFEIKSLAATLSDNDDCSVTETQLSLDNNVVIATQSNDQVKNNEHSTECKIFERVTGTVIEADLKSDSRDEVEENEKPDGDKIIENVVSSCVEENVVKDTKKDKISGNQNITIPDDKSIENSTELEMDVDEKVDGEQNDKILTETEMNQSVDSSTDKKNTVKDTEINISLGSDQRKPSSEEEIIEMETNNTPQGILKESEMNLSDDMDDDVVEIIEKCDNYIDLRSQSPISVDNDTLDDSEKPDVSDSKNPAADDTSGESDKTKSTMKDSSNYYAIKTDYRLKPDVMLEIPMQNLIDVDDIDGSIEIDSEETSQDSVNKITEVTNKDLEKNTNVLCKEEKKNSPEKDVKNVDMLKIDVENAMKALVDDKSIKTENESLLEPANTVKIESNATIKKENVKKETLKSDENFINLYDDINLKNEDSEQNEEIKLEETTSHIPDMSKAVEKDTTQPSGYETRMTPDTADEAPEVSDSLGLLAESSRVRREDEDMEEDDDDDDDYDQDDESSNQMTAEHSEDSNAQNSEPDSKDQEDKTEDTERPFSFEKSSNDVHETAAEVVVAETVAREEVSSVDASSQEISKENTAMETCEELTKKDDGVTIPTTDEETVKPSETTVTDPDASSKEKDAEKSTPSKDDKPEGKSPEKTKQSPGKTMKLQIAKQRHILNIVDLEESSSSEDEVQKQPAEDTSEPMKLDDAAPSDVTSVNIPTGIEIMSTSGGNTSEIVTKEGEVVIQGVPKPPPHKPARLNTSEVTIKTAHASTESTLIIPETKMSESTAPISRLGLEIFNLDSDDDDIGGSGKALGGGQKLSALELDAALRSGRCLRRGCGAGAAGGAAGGALAHYCEPCARAHQQRTQSLVEGIKNMTPLLDLNMEKLSQDLVEISDSDSDNETQEPKETIGEAGATILEEKLADMINSMWRKYKMDSSLQDAKVLLNAEMERLDNESKEINKMLNDCQTATDKLRNKFYSTFEPKRQELAAISIYDISDGVFIRAETDPAPVQINDVRQGKRRLSAASMQPAKKPAIPLGYTPLEPEPVLRYIDQDTSMLILGEHSSKFEDDKEVSVVQLSVESAPADLPPPGEPKRPPLKVGMHVYAMRNAFGSWSKAKILDAIKMPVPSNQFPSFRVKFEHKLKNPCKVLSARCLAYIDVAEVRLTIGTRVIALFRDAANQKKTEAYYSGIIAEIPNPVNNFRYLVFFDDGYAQYASHAHTRVVCANAAPVWEEVHPFSREFVRNYLCAYPERPMVRLHAGQRLNTEWNGKWWDSRVVQVDASLVQVHFEEDNRTEWIYRGSTRLEPLFLELQAAVRHRGRHLPRSKAQLRTNMPYVEYTRSYEQDRTADAQQEELRRQRAVAKKSTAAGPAPPAASAPAPALPHAADQYHSRVVYYTPRMAVRPYKMVPHTCGPKCKRSDVLSLKDLRSYNPLAKPLLSGWERQLVRHKGGSAVLYRSPCGRRLRSAAELQRYLRLTNSDAPVDLFDFNPDTHCLAEFVLSKCIVGKKDLSHGKENVPVPCVNSVDDSLPEFCSYNTERTPTAGVPLNLDPEFLCGCDCTDDCEDKTKCACWKLTLEGAKTIGLEGANVGYVFKRLPEPLPSGIYECNVRCKCKATCLNRVAQHPLQLKLQVFKTPNRGWGIRALNDVPKGAFLCVYAGNLLTDATANLDGLNEGDEYLAELDYIEVVEQMKEGYEEDVPEADKILDKKESKKEDEKTSSDEEASSEEDEKVSKDEEQDDDFRPGYIGLGVMEFNKRLRKRAKKKTKKRRKNEDPEKKEEKPISKEENADEDCITISDDEEVREPSRFTAQAGMGANEYVPKYRSVRAHFGRDEACYIMDAKVQGNIGRYLNHSCSPNVFVQNVFVDTHDPRFPWVAFFALSHIRAGTELTWNYNYDVGSVPGKVLYCYCGAPNCRRRLL
ncbi:LOW QUALITY PROTEIN: uncharacterized protein LOC115449535 [Manduca sexta]|uniref:LOW QUALITY PROTEIN: uncharacterized protein LOC115449535 n=1 Tax=Manduca sexta TaxID=7130 RepID=UPI00188F6C67|nr:LOW QUALITY PROTEIN: uncharacterized protein LOC115449535 [Manduca sexta]